MDRVSSLVDIRAVQCRAASEDQGEASLGCASVESIQKQARCSPPLAQDIGAAAPELKASNSLLPLDSEDKVETGDRSLCLVGHQIAL